jgi:hypothetical protein
MSDERSRKRERDARAWGVGLTPNDVLLENVRAGRWIVLHPSAASGSTFSLLSDLGGGYLGSADDHPGVPNLEGDIVWSIGFSDINRTIPVAAAGSLWNDSDFGDISYRDRLNILGLSTELARQLQYLLVVWPLSEDIRKDRLETLAGFSDHLWQISKKAIERRKHAALFFRNGDLAHLSCFQEASKPIDSRWSGRIWESERYRWPKGKACGICGGKTIKPKVRK